MQRIIFSLALILTAIGVLVGATMAYFTDGEESKANAFIAGAIDLKIDNESYYNGLFSSETSWDEDNLDGNDFKFFDFGDLKPGDYGEDTISLHVDTNDSFLCADVTLTSNDDNDQTEPESLEDVNGMESGELADLVEFMWWADDGDNVLENDEDIITQGTLGELQIGESFPLVLADSQTNIWSTTTAGGPIVGDTTYYIGKAWCFGTIGINPIAQDGETNVMSPAGDNGGTSASGEPEDGGLLCDGSLLANESQTDSLTADISFSAVQARHNPSFICESATCEFDSTFNLVVGSDGFETPVVATPQLWNIYPSPANGWNVEWRDASTTIFGDQVRPLVANLEYHRHVLGDAFQGDQYIELDSDWFGPTHPGESEPASVRVYKDIVTVPGANYNVHFAFAPRPNTVAGENRLEVKWGGDLVHDTGEVAGAPGAIVWEEFNIIVQATSTLTRIEFTDLGTSNSSGTFVDDLVVTQQSCALPLP